MSFQEAVQELKYAPLADRLQAIELLLQSMRGEIAHKDRIIDAIRKPFRVRTFNLGTDIQIDRDEIYADRVF
jgi:hypothetical protein